MEGLSPDHQSSSIIPNILHYICEIAHRNIQTDRIGLFVFAISELILSPAASALKAIWFDYGIKGHY